jgi:Na+-driven multidrug efflux pump
LNAHNIYNYQTIAALFGTISCFIFNEIYIKWLLLGIYGHALTYTCFRSVEFISLIQLSKKEKIIQKTLIPVTNESFKNCFIFLWDILPIAIIVFTGYFFDMVELYISGFFSTDELSSQLIFYNIFVLVKMIAEGFSCAITTYVGNAMGAGDH